MKRVLIPLFIILFAQGCSKDEGEDAPAVLLGASVGCTDEFALNFDVEALFADNSCEYSPVSCADCDLVIDPDKYSYDNNNLSLPAGSVICFPSGTRNNAVFFNNFQGTASAPFHFTNCDGQVKIVTTSTAGVRFFNSSHVRFTGTGSEDFYGIQIDAAQGDFAFVAERKCTDFEIDHIEVLSSNNSGISVRTDPTCDGNSNRGAFVQRNTHIHHNHITNTRYEGMYVGGSHWNSGINISECAQQLIEPELKGVRIYNNIVENTGNDGIQVGSAVEDSKIFNNIINDYGKTGNESQQAGMQINPGTTGEVFNNIISNGPGRGMFLQGSDLFVYNNIILNTGQDGMMTTDRKPKAGTGFYIINNTFYNINGDMLEMISKETSNNVMYNNIGLNVSGQIMKNGTNNVVIDVLNNVKTNNANDIMFVDAGAMDFRLKDTSPLIDSGLNVSSYNINFDFLFNPRVKGEKIDLGAHEVQ